VIPHIEDNEEAVALYLQSRARFWQRMLDINDPFHSAIPVLLCDGAHRRHVCISKQIPRMRIVWVSPECSIAELVCVRFCSDTNMYYAFSFVIHSFSFAFDFNGPHTLCAYVVLLTQRARLPPTIRTIPRISSPLFSQLWGTARTASLPKGMSSKPMLTICGPLLSFRKNTTIRRCVHTCIL
jgi:hypothetical protein